MKKLTLYIVFILSLFITQNTKTFLVGGFKYGNWLIPSGLGILVLHFILKYTFDLDYLMFLLIPVGLLVIYYLTIGRKDYLALTMTK